MDESQVADRGAAQLRIFFRLRGLQEFGRVAREEERLENLPADVRGGFRLVQLLQFTRAVDQAKLPDGLAAQRLIFLALRRGEKTFVIAADHVAAKNGVLHGSVACRGIDFRQRLARFSATEDSQIFDRFALQLGTALSARDSAENFAGLRRAALRHDKERLAAIPRNSRQNRARTEQSRVAAQSGRISGNLRWR